MLWLTTDSFLGAQRFAAEFDLQPLCLGCVTLSARGFETRGRPCLLLLHGFPELAYSWRKVMPALAEAGYHVIAPDQRGYGRTTGWDTSYDGGLASFRLPNLVRDALGVVHAFGYRSVDAVIGHDFGSSVAAWCALIRPDVFPSHVSLQHNDAHTIVSRANHASVNGDAA